MLCIEFFGSYDPSKRFMRGDALSEFTPASSFYRL